MRSIAIILAAWLTLATGAARGADLVVDAAKAAGDIRAVHGVNGGTLNFGETIDLTERWKSLRIPITRLHDCNWPCGNVVDIHAVFPDFQADPAKPENYDFRRTDDYLAAIVKSGSGIVYRLGESIEHSKRKYHVHPPADAAKWAEVCAGIVRHYNEGWAGGQRYNIKYWEIWNEPENRPAMWSGSDDDYCRLYVTTAKVLKAHWPDLKVGGPGAGYSGEVIDGRLDKPAPLVAALLAACKRESAPLDFFSWHLYTDSPVLVLERAKAVRAWLDANDFAKTESHLNEWSYLPGNDWGPIIGKDPKVREAWYEALGGPAAAAFTASVLIGFQDSPVDVANFYSGDTGGFGLFNAYGGPKRTFYAFKAFQAMLDTPHRVEATGGEAGRLAVLAGVDAAKHEATILVSHYRAATGPVSVEVRNLPWKGATHVEVFVADAARDLERVQTVELPAEGLKVTLDLQAPAVGLIKLRKAGGK